MNHVVGSPLCSPFVIEGQHVDVPIDLACFRSRQQQQTDDEAEGEANNGEKHAVTIQRSGGRFGKILPDLCSAVTSDRQ